MKILNKQNFVKGKITKYKCISFAIIFIILKFIYVKITLICESERSLFFLYKKVLRKAGWFVEHFAIISKYSQLNMFIAKKGMASDALTLQKNSIRNRKNYY